jgi:threonine dehydratase
MFPLRGQKPGGQLHVSDAEFPPVDEEAVRRARGRVAENITDLIGRTPMVRLCSFDRPFKDIEIWAKCEFMNPGGSVKDRAAYRMIQDDISAGRLTRD